ncbi:MAG: BREX-1 system adenine-specific DNA-methyltransferase PglX [Defluviitaleaceae bacterium]|nr:BREX-1 system adenine-specific DNA-methyltransferase PglX [Defluviitaleaceae bacterium]
MNITPIIFNREILKKYLDNFQPPNVADYEKKYSEIQKWKKAIDEGRFHKTKETTIQGRFLSSVFDKVLGYTSIESTEEWNQHAEYKSVLDSTQADCGLGFFSEDAKIVRAVMELKDANTNLDKKQNRDNHLTPVEQAFQYAHKNGSGCGWVIVSNFIEIRLYKSASSLEYEQFFVTNLDDEPEFNRFYFLLCRDNLISKTGKSIIDRLYDDNELARAEISNQFYNDYKTLRSDLFDALQENNPDADPITLFGKAQKILDRFIFVCFCENRMLLPQGIFKKVLQAAKSSFVLERKNLVWEEFRGLFHSIDRGNPPMQINGYNGGLFKQDSILDSLIIPDNVLENFQKLVDYDFGSDLNVNILGHIFEYSIADIEAVKAQIEGKEVDRSASKQKSDGIYYTPNYVTKFIVDKTIGRWLADEKERIKNKFFVTGSYMVSGIPELKGRKITITKWEEISEKYDDDRVNYPAAVKKLHIDFWEVYVERLKTIKVLDPACGSGAFLNCAFDYLAEEGRYAIEMYESLREGQINIFDWDTHILQNNLFGVDLNPESIEITKLSLWLKTADNKKPLAYLDDSIKVGNSIINDPTIVEDAAFNWEVEFPEIMAQGGFDVVIGNPPYGASLTQAEKDYIASNYTTTEYNFDTYKTFMELGLCLTNEGGYMGYITPNTYFVLEKGATKLRKFLFENYTLLDITELYGVFPTAVVEPAISIFKNSTPLDNDRFEVISIPRKTDLASTFINDGLKTLFMQTELREREGYIFNYKATGSEKLLREKIDKITEPLSKYFHVLAGVKPYEKGKGNPPQTTETLNNKPFEGYEKLDETWKPLARGKSIGRYTDEWIGEYIKYGEWLAAPRNPHLFAGEKLFIRRTSDYPLATYYANGKIGNNSVHCIFPRDENTEIELKYVLGLINSRLMKWIFRHDNFHMVGKPFAEIKAIFVERFPIIIAHDRQPIITLVDALLEKCQSRFDKAKEFSNFISNRFKPSKITEKLLKFYLLDFNSFLLELKKQKVKLTMPQEMDLMKLFNEKANEIISISKQIENIDVKLDEVVFTLYSITPEERDIIVHS